MKNNNNTRINDVLQEKRGIICILSFGFMGVEGMR